MSAAVYAKDAYFKRKLFLKPEAYFYVIAKTGVCYKIV